MFSSLRSRLFLAFAAIIVITLLAVVLTMGVVLRTLERRLVQTQLRSNLAITSIVSLNLLRRGSPPEELMDLLQLRQDQLDDRPLLRQVANTPTRTILLNVRGQVIADSDPEQSLVGQQLLDLASPQLADLRQLPLSVSTADGRRWHFAGQVLRMPIGAPLRTPIILAHIAPFTPSSLLLGQATDPLLWAGAGALLISLLLALAIARSVSRPLARITQATEAIAQGDFDQQLEEAGSLDEIERLAASFNVMTRRVAASQQAQRDFVANVSHDLKTPITSIQGFAQALVDGTAQTSDDRQKAAAVIYDEAGRMVRMVDQLLDLVKLEAGEAILHRESVNLAQLLESCCQRLRLRAAEAGVALDCQVAPLPPVLGDGDRLMQVFTNLLDNALQHTPPGGRITIATTQRSDQAGRLERIQVSVTDTGHGIPAEDLPRLFERFYQVDKSRTGPRSGSGLGLAIVREIVEAHGGQVSAESVVGLGARFLVALPPAGAAQL